MNFEKIEKMVSGEKCEEYGPIGKNFIAVAHVWSGILGVTVTPEQVPLCMIGFKLCRENAFHKQDNLDDMVGYVICLDHLTQPKPVPHPMQGLTPEERAKIAGNLPNACF